MCLGPKTWHQTWCTDEKLGHLWSHPIEGSTSNSYKQPRLLLQSGYFFFFSNWPSGQGRLKRPTQPTLCDSQSGSVYCVVWCIKERWSVINPMKFNLNRWFHLRYNNNPLLPDNKLIIIQYYKLLLWLSCPKSILITNW